MSSITPNILFVTDKSDRGESAMIIGLHQREIPVRVFGRLSSPYMQAIQSAGIPVVDVSWSKKLDCQVLELIRRTVREHKINITHSMASRAALHMVLATRPLYRDGESPHMIAYLGVTGNVAWWSPLSWFRYLNPRIDRIICVAEGVRQYLLNDVRFLGLKLDPNKVVTIHKGHRLEWYQSEPADLSEFQVPEHAMVVTVASRLRPRKGLGELIRALRLSNPERNIHLLFIGHEGNNELHREVARLPHPDRVHFTGFRKDAPAIMAASDVCCLPVLRGEGLSRAVIEGMAYAVAPLVTDVGGNAELVVNHECGLVVQPGDEQALATAMEYLYDHPDERRRMGQAARQRIDRCFRSEETIDRTLALYQQVLAE